MPPPTPGETQALNKIETASEVAIATSQDVMKPMNNGVIAYLIVMVCNGFLLFSMLMQDRHDWVYFHATAAIVLSILQVLSLRNLVRTLIHVNNSLIVANSTLMQQILKPADKDEGNGTHTG